MKKKYGKPICILQNYVEQDVIATSGYMIDGGDMTHSDIFETLSSGVE
ncbi:MAG: hypothetical protein ACI4RO_03765 [Candidatus Scatosoma sp.]